MRNKINLLSNETIIKIAAGEIIENPASVIKELVENSIDADSDKISIEIKNNGKDLIKITDNGYGFKREDLRLAFKRHTTSKIKSIVDLDKAITLGFRGEALSSISNVSSVTVITKTLEDSIGTIAKIDTNGDISFVDDIVTNNGTTIICEDLFANMPVRRKYLDDKNYEINKTNDILNRLALSNLNISIDYVKDDKLVFKTNKNNTSINNIYSILGKQISENLIEVSHQDSDFKISGFISNNNIYKSNRNHQYIFVNGRAVSDVKISRLIEREYGSIIPINRYPIFILYIQTDSSRLDVNIHPKKDQIKFLDFNELEVLLSKIIREFLMKSLRIYNIEQNDVAKKDIFNIYEEADKVTSNKEKVLSIIDLSERKSDNKSTEVNEQKDEEYVAFNSKISINNEKTIEPEANSFIDYEERKIFKNGYRYIGSFLKQYLILEDSYDKVLYFLDQHAVHERINYEKLIEEYKNDSVLKQGLLSPYIIELTKLEFEEILQIREILDKIGFETEEFGDNSIIIRTVPAHLENINLEILIKDILDNNTMLNTSVYDVDPYKIMKKACSLSIKTGETLSNYEVNHLIESLNNCKMPLTCPHGRPTLIKFTKNQLDKEFFRIQNEG